MGVQYGHRINWLLFFYVQKEYPKYIPKEPLAYYDEFIKSNCKVMLKHRDRQGRRIYLCKLGEL